MGVPKFFRYISERYPCLSELAREHSMPEFDNLYLDVNGIVHNCSHPDDGNIHFHLDQAQIFQDIFNYMDKLFYLIKPQKLFFLAIDGVAPRAKMNQQRSRRFRTAREAEQLEAKALKRGEQRKHDRFDSNCITPGTEFMDELQKGLRNFLRIKVSTDPLWKKCQVILSGQEVPGEGEHKIMDYIRYMKAQPNFDPNTRHCLYGLDADLIILGLCTHELHFVVLREEVKFGKNVKRGTFDETRFFLLHLGLLREYLELEFAQLSTPEKPLDVAQLIDDWVLMGFMVGNDFIPHLPCLHISSNALPLLYKAYIELHPKLGGNINEQGKLNMARLEMFMHSLSKIELELFEEHYDDLKYMHAKTEAFDVDVEEIKNGGASNSFNDDLSALIDNSMKLYEDDFEDGDDVDLSDEETAMKNEFQNYKRNYYRNKFKTELHSSLIDELSLQYVTALQWILDYYYRGVQSWNWFYPYHYAPFIGDLTNIRNLKVTFDLGEPFLPFQQLLAVMPAASSALLPPAYHHLMLNENSPLAEFYPKEFESDLNGKKNEWEAVVLIPFIDERRLLHAMQQCESQLTAAERQRNRHGPMYQYDYSEKSLGSLPALEPLKALQHVHATELARWSKEVELNLDQTVCIELPNAARHVFFPGFPTMKHLEFDFELRADRVRIFDQPSRNQSVVLLPKLRSFENTIFNVASMFLEQIVHIGWPHLIKAKVERICTEDQSIDQQGIKPNEARRFETDRTTLEDHFSTRMGIKFPNYNVILYVRTYTGSNVDFGPRGNVFMRDTWSTKLTPYPAQGVVADIKVQNNMRKQFNKIEQLFPAGSTAFFIGSPNYGNEVTVLDPMLVYSCGRLQVSMLVSPAPNLSAAQQLQDQKDREFINAYRVCRELNMNSRCLGRMTGTVWVVLGPRRQKMENVSKHNIGLQLKFPRLNEERADYCRRVNNQWLFSELAMDLIAEYCDKYPEVINYFSTSNDRSEFVFEEDIYPNEVGQHHIEDLANWVRQQPHMKSDRVTCGSRTICKETVELLLTSVDEVRSQPVQNVKLQVKPHLLIKPNVSLPEAYKTGKAVKLFDRVVVVQFVYSVPMGSTGTVIAVHFVTDPNPVRLECVNVTEAMCEVLFDKPIPNCGSIYGIAEERVCKVPEGSLLQRQQQQQQQQQQKPYSEMMRDNWREQQLQQKQQPDGRYLTAAGSKYNPITMKTRVADEFVNPTATPAADQDVAIKTEAAAAPQNWRTQSKQAPLNQRSTGGVELTQAAAVEAAIVGAAAAAAAAATAGGGGGGAAATTIATPQAQTQALKLLLGLKSKQQQQQPQAASPLPQAQAASPLHLQPQFQFPTMIPSQAPALPSQMPKLPQPPLFWQREAQEQQQARQQSDLIKTQQWDQRQQQQQPQNQQ
ncbi:hypothetical protein KR215_003675, partial [Drosophila sulfurigaster]